MKVYKRILSVILVISLVQLSFLPIFSDDSNGQSGTGTVNKAAYAFYRKSEWGWKVSLYVAKDIGLSEEEYKSMDLNVDFYCMGVVVLHNKTLKISSNTYLTEENKLQEMIFQKAKLKNNVLTWQYSCPAPPVVCGGDIDTVNSFFLNNKLLLDLLNKLASQYGYTSKNQMVENLIFTYHNEENGEELTEDFTGGELGVNNIFPMSSRSNYVPWVIVYEPMICTYLADSSVSVFLTATEYAMSQGNLYNWHTVGTDKKDSCTYYGIKFETGRLYPQCMQSMVFRTLPSSVLLEESWFGYGTMDPIGDKASASVEDIISLGGWGMGYLSPMALPDIQKRMEEEEEEKREDGDLGVEIIEPAGGYINGTEVVTAAIVTNYYSDVIPDYGVFAIFTVTDDDGNLIYREILEDIAVPEEESTTIWFRWTVDVPDEGNIVCRVKIGANGLEDLDPTDNEDTLQVCVRNPSDSTTPSTSFYDKKPFGFENKRNPIISYSNSSWTFWDYDEGMYTLYECRTNIIAEAIITPDPDIKSAIKTAVGYTVRSGYGFEINGTFTANVNVTAVRIINRPAGEDYSVNYAVKSGKIKDKAESGMTDVSECLVYYPEFCWKEDSGSFTSTEKINGSFVYKENPDAEGDRIHYMPLWYPDGNDNYYVFANFTGAWTPSGELSACVKSNAFSVDGTYFDDWYISHY